MGNYLTYFTIWAVSITNQVEEKFVNFKKRIRKEIRTGLCYLVDKVLEDNDEAKEYIEKKYVKPRIRSGLELFWGVQMREDIKELLIEYRNQAIWRKHVANEFLDNVGDYLVEELRKKAKSVT